jgi:hypothetical protein
VAVHTADEVVRQERVEQRGQQRDLEPHPHLPQHVERRQRDQRERQEEEEVDHDRWVVGEERQHLDHREVEVVAAEDREVVEVLAERRRDGRVRLEPAVVDDVLDQRGVQVGVRVVAGHRHRQVGAPEAQHRDRQQQREDAADRGLDRRPVADGACGGPAARLEATRQPKLPRPGGVAHLHTAREA